MSSEECAAERVEETSSSSVGGNENGDGAEVDVDDAHDDDATPYSMGHISLHTTAAEGSIKLVITNLSSIKKKVNTSFSAIGNLPWRLAAKTETAPRTQNKKFFSVFVDCNPESESTLWSCDALVKFTLHSQKDGQENFTRSFTNTFSYNSNNWGFPSFLEWKDMFEPGKGYVVNDRAIVEAHIQVHKTRGCSMNPTFEFTTASESLTDGVLKIDGIRLYVSKAYLALYSPVFKSLFFGSFAERDLEEIPIEDIIQEEFIELLHVIYPSHKAVSAENVEYLLELGDRFQVQYVMTECERFLIGTKDLDVIHKLVWADKYDLAQLQDVCIRTFKSPLEIKQLKPTDEFKTLSDATKAALLERVFKLM